MELAVFFHDIIYDASVAAPQNEEESADLFLQFAEEMEKELGIDLQETKTKADAYNHFKIIEKLY